MKVRDWMSPDPVAVSPDTPVTEARRLLTENGFRHLPVVDDTLIGIVSDRDVAINPGALRDAVRRRQVEDLLDDDRPVEAVMSPDPHVIGPEAEVTQAARILVSRQIGALPVVDIDRRLVGIITAVDCLLASLDRSRAVDV